MSNSLFWMFERILHQSNNKLKIITQYEHWLLTSAPNSKFVYYKGLSPNQSYVGQMIKDRVRLDYEKGLVHMVTRRMGDHNFDYIAVRSTKKVEDAYDE